MFCLYRNYRHYEKELAMDAVAVFVAEIVLSIAVWVSP